ncbi:MAG: hypothetical protein JWP41_462 [Ramlibacter sp.]|nr:hypothetical protein [Ramlibacter sp.]
MNADDPKKAPTPGTPSESSGGSGEGAATALKALIKKRNMGEAPDTPVPAPTTDPRQ